MWWWRERFLCPVRALRVYRKHTSSFRSSLSSLAFLREGRFKDNSRFFLAERIKQVITDAYFRAGVSLAGFSPRPHKVRAWSTWVAFLFDCNLKSLLDAAYWRLIGVPFVFYLCDTSRLLSEDSWDIGSVVVAQLALSAQPRLIFRKHHKKN